MKKNVNGTLLRRSVCKFLLVMKLTAFLSLLLCLSSFASSFGQSGKVSIEAENTSVKQILKEIEQKTDYYFFYKVENIDRLGKKTVKFQDASIQQVLDELLNDGGFSYKVVDNYIAIKKSGNSATQQQKRTVSGTVTDGNGETLPGVSVIVKGTTIGITTNIDGKFSLNVPATATVLQFSFVGMKTQEVLMNGEKQFNVIMQEDAIGLEEVVAVGYGVVKKSDLTGAVGSVKTEDLSESATSSVMHMLSGKVAGLQVKQNSAQPGGGVSVLIRGAASTGAGNSPLYVIDGFPVSSSSVEPGGPYSYGSRNPLNAINPNDIESIEVLKDASATAIYGARAANGVILITTKSAQKGSFDVEYSFSYGVQKPKNDFDLLSGPELMEVWNHGYREYYRYQNNYFPYGDKGEAPADKLPVFFTDEEIRNAKDYNYEDMVTRNGEVMEHNFVIKSGSSKAKVYSSFNLYDQKGMLTNLDFKRYSGRINLDYNLSDKFTIGTRMTTSYIKNSNSQMGGLNDGSGMISAAYQFPRFIKPQDENGVYNLNANRPNIPNPLSFTEVTDNTYTYKFLASSFAQYQFTDWLSAKVKYGIDYNKGKRKSYLPKSFLYGANLGGKAQISQVEKATQLFEVTSSFNKEFGKLNLSGVVGYSTEEYTSESLSASNNTFLTDLFLFNKLEAGEADRPGVNSGYGVTKFKSYFSRVNLNWDSKYLLTLTMRGDGSDKFGENNKWGYFPSAAVAWRAIEEPFLSGIDNLSDLKLRVSYGQIGNSNIGGNAFAYYSVGSDYGFGNKIVKGIEQTSLSNPDLKWETTTELNLGLDFGLFDNKIHGTFEVYTKTVDDLLSQRSLASYLPISKVAANIGSTQSSGWELTLNTKNTNGELKWSTDISLGHFKDRWKTRNPEVILKVYQKEDDPLHAIFGYVSDGILQVGEEYPENPGIIPGEIKVKDINGVDEEGNLTGQPDGKITDADKVMLGSKQPTLNFGINNTLNYKNFDLSIYVYGMLDRDVYDNNKRNLGILQRENNSTSLTYDAWSSENQDGTLPSGIKQTYSGNSDFYRTNVNFARIKNITLGYTIDPKLLKATKLVKKARVFVDFSNVAVFTNYKGGDPETDSWAAYPFPFSVTFGANINF
ncbi:SusC/RagA family TonB-linked outer membrane protein [Prolixibacteraceae bacterium JC049]|nr:SusC/RagA family TonB-linked outer membrane protein [Prolixibacteraceae bacterium JC049]